MRIRSRPDSWWGLMVALLVAGNLGWTTYALGGYRPETFAVSAPLLLATLGLAWAGRLVARSSRMAVDWRWAWPVPFLIYAAVQAAVVSPVPWLGAYDVMLWLHLAAAFWLGWELRRDRRARRLLWSTVGLVVLGSVGLAIYQRAVDPAWLPLGRRQAEQYLMRSGGPFGIPNSFAALLLLVVPPAGAVAFASGRRGLVRIGAAVVAAAGVVGLALTLSRGAWLSALVAATVAPLWATWRPWRWRLGLAAVVLVVLGAAGTAATWQLPAVRERVEALRVDRGERTRPIMWGMAWELFRDSPVWGSGAGSYRVLLERHRPEEFRDAPKWAHNDYLNTLSDYGLLGAVLLVVPLAAAGLAARRAGRAREEPSGDRRRLRLAWSVALLAFGLSLLVDFHLKIPAVALVLGLVLAEWLASGAAEGKRLSTSTSARWFAGAGALLAFAGALAVVRPRLEAEGLRYAARQAVDDLAGVSDPAVLRRTLEPAREQLEHAVRVDPRNGQAWADLALTLIQRAHYQPGAAAELGRSAEQAARRALACSEVAPEFWLYLGMALDLQGRWAEAGGAFGRALQLAPNHQLGWYYQAHHFSLRPATMPLARAAIATCLRLDPGNPAAIALRQRLAVRAGPDAVAPP